MKFWEIAIYCLSGTKGFAPAVDVHVLGAYPSLGVVVGVKVFWVCNVTISFAWQQPLSL